MVLDHIGREDDPVACFRGKLSHHEVLGEIVLEAVHAADGIEGAAPSCDGWTDGEVHPFDHSRDQCAGPKIGVDAGGFEG